MRIAMICPYDVGVPGGVREQTIGLAAELRRRRHDVTVIAPGHMEGIEPVGRSIPIPVNGSVAQVALQPTAAIRTARLIRRGGFDVVHVHEPLAPSISIPALLASPAPVVGTFHAAGHCAAYRLFRRPLTNIAKHLAVRVAVSPAAAAFAAEHVGGEYRILFNGVDVDHFRRGTVARLPHPTILFLGRHEPRQGLGVLLEAVHTMDEPVDLFVAGRGPDTERLRRRFADDRRIHWLGRLSDARKTLWMRMSTVVCVPSLGGESFGVVPLEAMAAHTTVVMSDIPAYRRISEDGRAAVLVPPGDVPTLARALSEVVNRRVDTDSLRDRADKVAEHHSFERLVDDYLEIYRSLIER
jgi:phosphatidyl-myo-inositol alpha-mannosyltransferase